MSSRNALRSTTMLSGVVGCTFLAVWTAAAADMSVFAKAPMATTTPTLGPAVDAVNEKVEAFGGSLANLSVYGVNGSVTVPLQGQFGAQVDGSVGSLDGDTFGVIAGHWFWRDPSHALFGIYASETYWDRNSGANAGHVAAEGEYYWGRFTLQGIAGVEFGNTAASASTVVGPVVTTTFLDTYSIKTRFFDEINFKYYFGDDLSGYVGHRYLGGKNALALGGEIARPIAPGVLASAFIEGRVGEDDFHGIWGGVKLYFGPTDKPLIARHRQEDPNNWNLDSLYGILNNHSSSSATSCPVVVDPGGGNCETPYFNASDRRLKRDIVLLVRLANGIGIYRYRYLWSDTVYVGVMAQEVAAIVPAAVMRHADGFLRVDYARLGMRLLTLNEWQAGKSMTRLAA